MIKVSCAIIEHNGKVLCAQRSSKMDLPNKWEFPGGKVKEETFEECLIREIREELGVEIKILEQLPSNQHNYSMSNVIELIPFRCSLQTFKIVLFEHTKVEWLPIEKLKSLDWAEADIPIVNYYIKTYK
ncbi:(deoxy)nucleoside triphosphate pyrophosphohydrolase [Salegentibacter sp. JZCK2]|uniref:(deoxy)nucleoside triphosphate pyrophosphohydrolase n=1 Tax=Salegentibacter tibetensis TaxID=2873600 RepID=UPI001CCAB065|nr:(deoxy)nucleoside triphosphate pyrophosphohydrolase [Salegentibacter tibetensis]MBZ9729502.1 (deoxy)nucleoside triphosphate pyrophosphohydrolase [Salegentibacter tibetensis]